MHYVAIVRGNKRTIEVRQDGPCSYTVTVDGRPLNCDVAALTDVRYSILHEGRSHTAQVEARGGVTHVTLGARPAVAVEVLDMRRMQLREARQQAQHADGPVHLTAPMPGKVVDIAVEVGQRVSVGQGMVVVEAMKMENELRAPKDGLVRDICIRAGATVDSGALLCVIE